MKRQKIKNKYKNIIDINTNITEIKKESKILINILKTIGLIFLLLIWNYIPMTIMYSIGINYEEFSQIQKIFYLLSCDISLILILIFIYRKSFIKDLKNFFNKNFLSNLETPLRYWGIGVLVMITSNIIINTLTPNAIAGNEESVRSLIDIAPLFMAFELAIYAPITEELIFRKSIKDITNNKYIYILLSGLIFGGMHVIGSITSTYDILYLIPYSALGIAFASLYHKTNNLFSTITVHSIHNTLTLVLYLIGSAAL